MGFYDLKGIVSSLLGALEAVRFEPAEHPTFHPGKCARVYTGDQALGVLGEIHPLVRQRYDFPAAPVLAAELDLEALLVSTPTSHAIRPVPAFPPVLEDLAVVVEENVPAEQVEALIRQAGGTLLQDVRLFDLYRGEQIGSAMKSLAYSLTYQAPDRTLTDEEVAQVRNRIVKRLEETLQAHLRA